MLPIQGRFSPTGLKAPYSPLSLTNVSRRGIILLMKVASFSYSKAALRGILGLIYPPLCQICGRSLDIFGDKILCEDCFSRIKLNDISCAVRGACCFAGTEGRSGAGYHFDTMYAVSSYDDVMRECIHKFKYKNGLALEKLFSGLMCEFAKDHIDMRCYDWLVPVPLHDVKQRERTFNQAFILCANLSRRFSIPVLRRNLVRVRAGKPQMTLSKKKRLSDIKGAFKVKDASRLKNRSVLLIDDVFTTGATADECSKVIKEAGADTVDVFTLSRSE